MRKTKESNAVIGDEIVRFVFDVVFERTLMISKDAFESIKKELCKPEFDNYFDDNNVFIWLNNDKRIEAFIWILKFRYAGKDWYEICRIRYFLPDNLIIEDITKEKCDHVVDMINKNVFAILTYGLDEKSNNDNEKCYIRSQVTGDVVPATKNKDESYVKFLPLLSFVCSVNWFKENVNERYDIEYLKTYPENHLNLCSKCNARVIRNTKECVTCKIVSQSNYSDEQRKEIEKMEMAVRFVEEQLIKNGDTILDANPALDVYPNLFVTHDGVPCGVLVRTGKEKSDSYVDC